MNESLYTYDDVRAVLCEACRLKISDLSVSESDGLKHYHPINGRRIECLASTWRVEASKIILAQTPTP